LILYLGWRPTRSMSKITGGHFIKSLAPRSRSIIGYYWIGIIVTRQL